MSSDHETENGLDYRLHLHVWRRSETGLSTLVAY